MSIIKVNCVDQTLVFENTPVIASGGLEENFVQFSFCSQWDGFTKTAVFWRSESEVFHNPLDAEDGCQVPPEVTASDGVIYFGVFGVDSAGRQRTSEVLTYRIVKGAITEGTVPSDPTPDIYTQLLAKYQEMVEIAEDTRKKEQAFEQAMTAAQQAFEQAMAQRQTQHEADVDADQQAFEAAMNAAHEAYKQEIRAMIEAGLLPDDSITTEKLKDGVVTAEKLAPGVMIDAFTKTETLTSATGALFGLGADAVPDDVFGVLSRFQNGLGNEYVWAKGYTEKAGHYEVTYSGQIDISDNKIGSILYYSDTFSIDTENEVFVLDNPVKFTWDGTASTANVLKGKSVIRDASSGTTLYKIGANATITNNLNNVNATSSERLQNISVTERFVVVCYVNSPDLNAYPVDDGYTYNLLGQIGGAARIATGSYTGTGTYGESNPNSLTFEFEPKLLIISAVYNNNTAGCIAVIVPGLCGSYSSQGLGDKASSYVNILGSGKSGNTVTWYSNGSVGLQLNSSAVTYNYIAIG